MSDQSLTSRVSTGFTQLGVALRHLAWVKAGPGNLTPTQGQILGRLHGKGAMEIRPSDLAEALAVTLPTISDAVSTLSAKGLVTKRRSRKDGRATALSLTRAGRREAERVAVWPDSLTTTVENLDADEQAGLLRALVKMIRALQVRGEIPGAQMCPTCSFFRPHVHADGPHPHHCDLLNAAFGDRELRLDCPVHEVPETSAEESTWKRFVQR